MYDELVKSLRRGSNNPRTIDCMTLVEAADAIEELQKRVPPVPHGRLIDADELHKLFIKKGKEFKGIGGAMLAAAAWCVANAPTIIPADHEEEEMK